MDEPRIALKPGETAVIGYGSLLSKTSIARTLGRAYDGPFVLCRVDGWRRTWDAAVPNKNYYFENRVARIYPEVILYLNATRVSGSAMNAVLIVLNDAELAAMHKREWIYDAPDVTDALREVRVTGGRAILYAAKPEHCLRGSGDLRREAVRATYLKIVAEGLEQLGAGFSEEYLKTTDEVPKHWVIEDRLDA
jgi:hypothetical protein